MGQPHFFQASAPASPPGQARLGTHTGHGRAPSAIEAAPLLAQRQAERHHGEPPRPTEPLTPAAAAQPADQPLQATWGDNLWFAGTCLLGGYTLYLAVHLIVLLVERALEATP